jgi:competence protein ComFC
MLLIAKRFARLRNLPVGMLLQRQTSTKQRDASARRRIEQAKVAFYSSKVLDTSSVYLVLDDVITTGATVKYASKVLLDAGAKEVWVASISRQPLD